MMLIFPRYVVRWPDLFNWRRCPDCGKRFGIHGEPLREGVIYADLKHDNTAALLDWSKRPTFVPRVRFLVGSEYIGSAPDGIVFNYVRQSALSQHPIVFPPDHVIFTPISEANQS